MDIQLLEKDEVAKKYLLFSFREYQGVKRRRMRIAIFHDLPSGGAKRTLYESMKRLCQRHVLDVYTLDTADREFCDLRPYSNAEYVFHFSPSKRFHSPFGRLNQLQRWRELQKLDQLARRIAGEIDDRKYDVVFAQPCMWTQAPLVLRYLCTPTLYFCHEPPRHLYENHNRDTSTRSNWRDALDSADPLIRLYRTTAQRFDRSAVQSAKSVLVNSAFSHDRVKQIYGIHSTICYLGVDTDLYCPSVVNTDRKYVLSVGAIQPHKGFDFLIESLGHVDPAVRPGLYLIGNMENPTEKNMLQALAKEKGVDLRIEVGVDPATLVQKYNAATLVVYAPYNEPFGLVPLEAMACGKPVVGVNEGGVKETVIHAFSGLLVDRDARKFGQALQTLLETPTLIDQYGRNGRLHVLENWSWDKAVQKLEGQLSRVIE
jgi:glycosyltransferase involved in cell wall biosynthesis